MNQHETGLLLTKVAAYDHRNLQDADADLLAWHEVLKDQDIADCMEAVVKFFTHERGWIMPSDVFRLARTVRHERSLAAARERAIEATPQPINHASALKKSKSAAYAKAFETGRANGNAERAYWTELRKTGDNQAAQAAAQATRKAAQA